MDFVKIAACVAAEPTSVPGGGGDAMDWTFELVQDEDAGGSAPTFLAKGIRAGEPFECKLGVELDDRSFEFEHVSGLDMSEDPDAQGELLEALYESDAYNAALSAFEGGEDPGPPSDPGPPWDTLEEKRGEK